MSGEEPFCYGYHVQNKKKRPRYNHYPLPSQEFSEDVSSVAAAQFVKVFNFSGPSDCPWTLSDPSQMFVEGQVQVVPAQMLEMKTELNSLKNALSDKEIQQWHAHTSSLHYGAKIIPHLRQSYKVELCTQAWCKFHEILTTYPIIPSSVQELGHLSSVHLCEAPGAFITSLNQFCKSRSEYAYLRWRWIGTTLNPYYEGNSVDSMIADDRFIQGTIPHWFFGVDNSGDLMSVKNLEALFARTQSEMQEVHMVTADGSVNCLNDPGEQESVVSQLHYCEAITALYILADGGSFLIKMFTMFEQSSCNLMYLLNCCFETVSVFKPSTSKAGNSEVYVICLNYMGKNRLAMHFPVLLQAFQPSDPESPMFSSLPSSFLEQLTDCCTQFKGYQMEAIANNMRLFDNMTDDDHLHAESIRDCCTKMFVEKCLMQMIQKKEMITKQLYFRFKSSIFNKCLPKRLQGTFNERVQEQQKTWHERIQGLKQEMLDLEQTLADQPAVTILENTRELNEQEIDDWNVIRGREVHHMLNSPFCSSTVFGQWREACVNSKLLETCSCKNLVVSPEVKSCLSSALISLSTRTQDSSVRCLSTSPDDESSHLLQFLKEQNILIEFVSIGENDSSRQDIQLALQPKKQFKPKVHLVYSCAGRMTQEHEPTSKFDLLSNVLIALKAVCIGGCVILQVDKLLTRFKAGLMYILHKVFDTVHLCDMPTESGLQSSCLIIGQNYRGCYGNLIWTLEDIYCIMSTSTDQEAVLQIVPMANLYENEFDKVLTSFNEACLMRQVVAIVNLEITNNTSNSQEESTNSEPLN